MAFYSFPNLLFLRHIKYAYYADNSSIWSLFDLTHLSFSHEKETLTHGVLFAYVFMIFLPWVYTPSKFHLCECFEELMIVKFPREYLYLLLLFAGSHCQSGTSWGALKHTVWIWPTKLQWLAMNSQGRFSTLWRC